MEKVGRNEPCPCGSGKKFKNCHMKQEAKQEGNSKTFTYIAIFVVLMVIGLLGFYYNNKPEPVVQQTGPAPGQVWSEEHQHYH